MTDFALTEEQVAARLQCSTFTVRAWRRQGRGPRFMKVGRLVRYRPEDVAAYERRMLNTENTDLTPQ